MNIFTINDSHRCKFHLELDRNKYREYSAKIVENGGEIVSMPGDNVFTFTTQRILTEHYKDRDPIGIKHKYNVKYVDDCINEGKLLDIGEYELSNKKHYGCAHSLLYFGRKHCPVAELLQKSYTASLPQKIHPLQTSKTNSAETRRKPERTESIKNTQPTKITCDISTQTSFVKNLDEGGRNQKDAIPNEDLDFEDLVDNKNEREDKRRNPFYSNKSKINTKESTIKRKKDEYQEIIKINNLVKDVMLARQEKERREELKKKEKEKKEQEINENLQRIDKKRIEKEEILDRIKKLERIQQEIRKEKQVCSQEKKRIKEELEEFERKLKRMEEIRNKQLKRIEELERIEQVHRSKEEEWIQQEKQMKQKLTELEIDLKIKTREVEALIYSTACDNSVSQKVQQSNVNNLCKRSKTGEPSLESSGKRGISDSDIEENLSGIKRPRFEKTTGTQMERGDFTSLEKVSSSLQKTSTSTQVPASQTSAEDIFYDSCEELFDSDLINPSQCTNKEQLDNLEKDSEIANESQLPSILTQLSMNFEKRRDFERVMTDQEEESPVLDDISKAFLQDDSETDCDSVIESHSPRYTNFDPDVQIIKKEKNVDTSIIENIKMEPEVKMESPVRIHETLKSIDNDNESISDAETITLSHRDVLLKTGLKAKNQTRKVKEASVVKKENFLSSDSLQQNDSVEEFLKTNEVQEKQNCEKENLNQVEETKGHKSVVEKKEKKSSWLSALK